VKANVVMKDEKESNFRQILNYGHTFGHVIELMDDYKVSHGEAVATGMRIAADLALKLRYMPQTEWDIQKELLDMLGLGKKKSKGLIKKFIEHMKKDKKAKGDIRVVLVDRLGRCHQEMGKYSVKVDARLLREVLKDGKWIDDVEKPKSFVSPSSPYSYSSASTSSSYSSPSYSDPSTSYSSSSGSSYSSSGAGETDLQKRLREMRERAEQRRREQGGGGLDAGGFLP